VPASPRSAPSLSASPTSARPTPRLAPVISTVFCAMSMRFSWSSGFGKGQSWHKRTTPAEGIGAGAILFGGLQRIRSGDAMLDTPVPSDERHQLLVRTLAELRPRLHRYCARMTGSAVDAEDVVQEVMLKVLESPPDIESFSMLERWLIRVAHNAAIDFLRRRARQDATHTTEDLDMIIDPSASVDTSDTVLVSLRTFIRLPALQRSTVIFKDVLGYSLDEVAEFTGSSIAAVKSALQRGRANLKEFAKEPDDRPLPPLSEHERQPLTTHAGHFNGPNLAAV